MYRDTTRASKCPMTRMETEGEREGDTLFFGLPMECFDAGVVESGSKIGIEIKRFEESELSKKKISL